MIRRLEVKGEQVDLSETETTALRESNAKLFRLASLHNNILHQRSRQRWLKEGDANSKFFHGCINRRRSTNDIINLEIDGRRESSVKGMKEGIYRHLEEHFRAKGGTVLSLKSFDFKKISNVDNLFLVSEFKEEEIKEAVWDCEDSKSPGPDGVTFDFLKEFWEKIKVLSMLLANRLRLVLEKIISKNQTAFIKGRQMLDGVLIANEMVEEAKRRGKETILFKVDFGKAYDSVNWNYLEEMMKCMGFCDQWRRWIAECLNSASVPVMWVREAAKVLNCKVGVIPFIYLGLPIGANPRRL
ncbi:LINE-1 reverse transcriptase like, partial [Trifolium medium]|nr:LINE-1 reverse transcriptase like [Trifolium medium]